MNSDTKRMLEVEKLGFHNHNRKMSLICRTSIESSSNWIAQEDWFERKEIKKKKECKETLKPERILQEMSSSDSF